MLYAVGTHIDFTKKKTEPEPKEKSRLFDVGTKIIFSDYFKDIESMSITPNIFVRRLHAL